MRPKVELRRFERPGYPEGRHCPVCGGTEEEPCVLVPIADTEDDGIAQAAPVHVQCLEHVLSGVRLVQNADRYFVFGLLNAPYMAPYIDAEAR